MADNLIYKIGKVSVAHGSTAVAFSGGPLLLSNAKAWDRLTVVGHYPVEIASVDSDSALTLAAPWPAGDIVSGDYIITNTGLNSFAAPQVARDVVAISQALNSEGYYRHVRDGLDAPDPRKGDDGDYARQSSTSKEWYKEGGVWIFVGVYGNFAFATDPWSSVTAYSARTVVPHQGKLWVSSRASTGVPPGSSAADWSVFYPFPTQSSLTIVFDAGGSEIAAGSAFDVPVGVRSIIRRIRMRADGIGSLVLDIRKRAFADGIPAPSDSICGAAKPRLISSRDYVDATLTGWATEIDDDDALRIVVESCTGLTRLSVTLYTDRIFT